jgi:hypothetical protein
MILHLAWEPVTRGGRTPIVTCWRCRAGHLNATNAMHREGWQEVRWRPRKRKRNARGHIAGVLLTFEYGRDGRLAAVTREDDEASTREWLLAALVAGPRKVSELATSWPRNRTSTSPRTRYAESRSASVAACGAWSARLPR